MHFGGNPFEGLNQTSVNSLLDMGFDSKDIIEALTYLKKQKNYSPVGEIDRALDLLQRSSRKAEASPRIGSAQQQSSGKQPVLKL